MAPGLLNTNDQVEKDVVSTKTQSNSGAPLLAGEVKKWKPVSDDDFAVLAVRNLVLDICMQNGGGHGGSALGMAAIGVALWKHVMRYNPCDPEWFDRDRFVLSNGKPINRQPTIFGCN